MPFAPSNRFRSAGALEAIGDRLRRVLVGPAGRARLRRLYHRLLMLWTGGRGLRSELPGGEIVRVSPEYRYLAWNPDEYAAFRDAVKPGAVALDIGANVGAYSLLLAQWAGAAGRVYAFEPAPQAFDGLVRHLRLNGLERVVMPVRAAVADATSPAPFWVASTAGQGRLAVSSDPSDQSIAVSVTTIDEFCRRERIEPDFIKIDVEGSELAVLRGARETLARGRGRLALFVEMHPSIWPTIGTSFEALEEELRRQDLALVPLTPTDDWLAVEGVCLRVVFAHSTCAHPDR